MTDVTDLMQADHVRICRLFDALADAARSTRGAGGASCPEWTVSAIWSRIADLLDLHTEAEYEICYFLMFGHGTDRADELSDAIGDLNDIRQAVAEARLHDPGCRMWWLAVNAARRTTSTHVSVIESGVLAEFRGGTSRRMRDDLGRQWAGFIAARRRDAAAPDHTSQPGRGQSAPPLRVCPH